MITPPQVSRQPETLTVPEACRLLRISKTLGYSLIARDEFPCRVIRAGRRVIVPRREVDLLLGVRDRSADRRAEVAV